MGALADSIGNKDAGHLIKAAEWNELVDALEAIDVRVTNEVSALQAHIGSLEDQLTVAQEAHSNLRSEFDGFAERHYRLTMSTRRTRYAIGELAELTAQVTDLWGRDLPSVPAEQRPWVDFVTVWGQLRPVAGYVSRGGAGDRTISVRTDANGQARVLLRAENAEGFTDEEEDEFSGALQTQHAATGMSLAETFLGVSTPMEALNNGSFGVMAQEYDRSDSYGVRKYLDTFYMRSQLSAVPAIAPIFTHRWKDYRTTVLAVVTNDNDPTTPDHGRGVASIHITYRDWISPWMALQYLTIDDTLVATYGDRLRPMITRDYRHTMTGVIAEIDDILIDSGILARIKYLRNINVAFEQLAVTGPPVFFNELVHQVQTGIAMQQTLQGVQMLNGFGDQQVAMHAFGTAYIASAAGEAVSGGKVDEAAFNDYKATVEGQLEGKVGQDAFGDYQATVDQRFQGKVDETAFTGYQATVELQLEGKVGQDAFGGYQATVDQRFQGKVDETAFTGYQETVDLQFEGKVGKDAFGDYQATVDQRFQGKVDETAITDYKGTVDRRFQDEADQRASQYSQVGQDVADVRQRTRDLETGIAVMEQKTADVEQTGLALTSQVQTVQSQVRNVQYFDVADLSGQMEKLNKLWGQFGS